jgi:DNA-binding NarL/FixJ family response regulator
MKPSVLLADDDETFRDLSREFLGPEFRVVASVGDGQSLVDAAHAFGPDLIITDISMPVLNGFQAIRQLKSVQPDARVIFLTAHGDLAFVAEARKINALGYVLKRSVASDLIPATREALEGRFFVSPAMLE